MQWFYAKGGTQHGPVSEEDIRGLIESREVAGSDLVWRDGMESWMPLSNVPQLAVMVPAPAVAQPTGAPASSPYLPPSASPAPLQAGYAGPQIPTYLWQSIVVTLLCCMPAGVVAIVFAARVEGLQRAGDIEGARRSSEQAKTWSIVSFVLGILVFALFFVAGFFGETSTTTMP